MIGVTTVEPPVATVAAPVVTPAWYAVAAMALPPMARTTIRRKAAKMRDMRGDS